MRARLALSAVATAVLIAGCDSSPTSPTPPPAVCTYQLAPSTTNVGPEAATASVGVTTGASCTWAAQVNVSWASISSGATGTGSGSIQLSIGENQATEGRELVVSVADQSVRMSQQGRAVPCEYVVTPAILRFDAGGGTGRITVSAAEHCAWSAVSEEPSWAVLQPAEGTGNGTIAVAVAGWPGDEDRRTWIHVGGHEVDIRQERDARPCDYSVTPVAVTLHWHHTASSSRVVVRSGCSWTVTSTAAWLVLTTPSSNDGDGPIEFSTGIYTNGDTRRAALEVRWPAPTAGQNVWVSQDGCRYGIGETTRTFPASGGTATLQIVTQPVTQECMVDDCPWTARSSASWIRIVSGSPGTGMANLTYEVLPNTTGAPRTGTIDVQGQVLTITQQ